MRREQLFLAEIVDAADMVARWLNDVDLDRWYADDVLRYAVVHQVMVVGKAAARLSPELKDRYPDIPWSRMVGFRNVVVQECFAVEWAIVWRVATEDLPVLSTQVAAMLQKEFPEAWQRFLKAD